MILLRTTEAKNGWGIIKLLLAGAKESSKMHYLVIWSNFNFSFWWDLMSDLVSLERKWCYHFFIIIILIIGLVVPLESFSSSWCFQMPKFCTHCLISCSSLERTSHHFFFFLWVMLGKGHGGLHKAPTKEERRKQKAKRRDRSDHVYWY